MGPVAVGVEVGPTRLRALRLDAARSAETEAVEVAWAARPPEESIKVLRERFGSGNVIAVALDMSILFVKRLELPPLPAEERRRIIATDPQRYFPVRDEQLVAGVREDDLVVATRADVFEAWMDALGTLGSVERVEPAPVALARYLAVQDVDAGLLVMADDDSSEATVARIEDRRIETLRKVAAGPGDDLDLVSAADPGAGTCILFPWREGLAEALRDHLNGGGVWPVPVSSGAPDSFAVAYGAALELDDGSELSLVSPTLARRVAATARRRAALHLTSLVLAVAVCGWSLDHRRAATLHTIEERVVASQARAAPVLDMRNEAASIAEEVNLLAREASGRSNPLDVLLALTRILPADAYVTQLAVSGEDWEIDGIARDAASLVPLLEGSDLFADVRFRTATTRVRLRNEIFDNFSLLFRHVPPA